MAERFDAYVHPPSGTFPLVRIWTTEKREGKHVQTEQIAQIGWGDMAADELALQIGRAILANSDILRAWFQGG